MDVVGGDEDEDEAKDEEQQYSARPENGLPGVQLLLLEGLLVLGVPPQGAQGPPSTCGVAVHRIGPQGSSSSSVLSRESSPPTLKRLRQGTLFFYFSKHQQNILSECVCAYIIKCYIYPWNVRV